MIPDLTWWAWFAGWLTVETTVVVALAATWARCLSTATAGRAVWQGALVAVTLLWILELGGARSVMRDVVGPIGSKVVAARVLPESDVTLARPVTASPDILSSAGPAESSDAVLWPAWIWWAGTMSVLGRTLVGRLALMRRHRDRKPAAPELVEVAGKLGRTLGLKRVTVSIWPRLRGPVAFGLWKPSIAVPADFLDRFPAAQREAMLLHELAHLAGRDPVWLFGADLLKALAWWHPAVWWLDRGLRAAGERAADESSTLLSNGPTALAEALVSLGRDWTRDSGPVGLGVTGPNLRSELAARVTRLLGPARPWRPARPLVRWGGIGLAGAITGAALLIPAPVSLGIVTLANSVRGGSGGESQAERTPVVPVPPPTGLEVSTRQVGIAAVPAVGIVTETPVKSPEIPPVPPKAIADAESGPTPSAPAEVPPASLVTRRYHVSMREFCVGIGFGEPPSDSEGFRRLIEAVRTWIGGPMVPPLFANPAGDVVGNQPGLYLNDRAGELWVRLPMGEQDALKQRLGGLSRSLLSEEHLGNDGKPNIIMSRRGVEPAAIDENTATNDPQVLINVQFAEVTERRPGEFGLDWIFGSAATNSAVAKLIDGTASGSDPGRVGQRFPLPDHLTNSPYLRVEYAGTSGEVAVLAKEQFRALRRQLEQIDGVDFLSAPKVSTLAGRQAQVSVSQMRTVVTGLMTNAPGGTNGGITYVTQPVAVGPTIDLVPYFESGLWRIVARALYTEFVGYDEPTKGQLVRASGDDGKVVEGVPPLARLRIRSLDAIETLPSGDTLVLRGPLAVEEKVTPGGWFHKSTTRTQRRRLYVFVTPEKLP